MHAAGRDVTRRCGIHDQDLNLHRLFVNDDAEGARGMLLGRVGLRVIEVLRKPLRFPNPLDGEAEDSPRARAAPDQIETASVHRQRVGLEDVLLRLAADRLVFHAQAILPHHALEDLVEPIAELAVVLDDKLRRVELPPKIRELQSLLERQLLTELLPQEVEAFFDDGTVEELENGQREVEKGEIKGTRLGRWAVRCEPQEPALAPAEDFDEWPPLAVDELLPQRRKVAEDRAL
jgi:hypothetical protein